MIKPYWRICLDIPTPETFPPLVRTPHSACVTGCAWQRICIRQIIHLVQVCNGCITLSQKFYKINQNVIFNLLNYILQYCDVGYRTKTDAHGLNGANSEVTTIRGRGEYGSNGDGHMKFGGNKPGGSQMFGDLAVDGNKSRDVNATFPTSSNYGRGSQYQQQSGGIYSTSQQSTTGNSTMRAGSQSSSDMSQFNYDKSYSAMDSQSQITDQAQLIEALAIQSLQDSPLSKELSQALATHLTAQLGNSNAELLAAKGKVLETMALLEKAQQHAAKLNSSNVVASPSASSTSVSTHSPNQAYMQPIKVNTHHEQQTGLLTNNAHNVPWSGPSTPNSMADSSNSSGYESHQNLSAKAANAHLKLLQQKSFPQRLAPQSPVPGYLSGKQNAGFARNGFRHPFLAQQQHLHKQRHTSESSSDSMVQGSPSPLDSRNSHTNMATPDPQAIDRTSVPPHLRDLSLPHRLVNFQFSLCIFFSRVLKYEKCLPVNVYFSRPQMIEDMIPPEYMGMFPPPPLPGHPFKFPPNFPPHIQGPPSEGLEFFPAFDPYVHGRLPPAFFGANHEMLLDMLPPHFFHGLPPFFQGFRPPR